MGGGRREAAADREEPSSLKEYGGMSEARRLPGKVDLDRVFDYYGK